MKIRRLETKDIDAVVKLWYETSVIAHNFIPIAYWKKNKEAMASNYLPNSETYLFIGEEEISGFITMSEDYLAAIFVNNKMQQKGVGKKLLNFVKQQRLRIQLKVYKKNPYAVTFYKSQGFHIIAESKEEETGEYEFLMQWNK